MTQSLDLTPAVSVGQRALRPTVSLQTGIPHQRTVRSPEPAPAPASFAAALPPPAKRVSFKDESPIRHGNTRRLRRVSGLIC
jgi:hypothetical protein